MSEGREGWLSGPSSSSLLSGVLNRWVMPTSTGEVIFTQLFVPGLLSTLRSPVHQLPGLP